MTSTFPDRIRQAALDFPGAHSTAWVQYLTEGNVVHVRMQAPEIMKEFRGNVKFGVDPKGILFFKSIEDLNLVGNLKIRNRRWNVSGSHVVAESEFGAPGEGFHAIARFVAAVDTAIYPIPQFNINQVGQGQFRPYDAVTCHIQATRSSGHASLNLGTNSIHKQVYFATKANTQISQSGVLFFPVLARLKTKPNGHDFCVADYSPDRIVFHVENKPAELVALFLPNKPIIGAGQGISRATWDDIEFMGFKSPVVEDDCIVEESA